MLRNSLSILVILYMSGCTKQNCVRPVIPKRLLVEAVVPPLPNKSIITGDDKTLAINSLLDNIHRSNLEMFQINLRIREMREIIKRGSKHATKHK